MASVSIATVVVNVLLLGALYSLVAIGFTLIFGVGGVLNLAHGASITLGAYSAYYAVQFGLGIYAGAVVALLVPAVFNLALYKGIIKPVGDNPVAVLILTLVMTLVVEQVFLAIAGAQAVTIPGFVTGQVPVLGGIEANRVLGFVLSWVLIGGLFFFVNRTKTGQAVLATSMSKKGSALVGIDPDRTYTYTWLIAGALAGVAGLFLGSFQSLTPLMGRNPLLLSFAIVVLGGLGSIRGSVIGAYFISLLDQLTIFYVSERLAGLAGLVVLVVVLLVRPQGLFGRELAEG
ncbi:branched-chain amino acid ABC transporter permease [Salinirubellus salinus]|jgi:branched-chain amino acid transport system permease protein|uniref:Branched-chain amino acid ABC transporter permease n=1 Tax=Salinirubellus salinus TaxID=1364945 RepID=A0A9E7UD06_9EURY|nr:branched-chain amino acid ABC transporter permease [Salinirubellus salinus]UWM56494.1 branched-chain amino acid ABC transporter permease [Salinirubellus salinus]